jgi:hypothetical protein
LKQKEKLKKKSGSTKKTGGTSGGDEEKGSGSSEGSENEAEAEVTTAGQPETPGVVRETPPKSVAPPAVNLIPRQDSLEKKNKEPLVIFFK